MKKILLSAFALIFAMTVGATVEIGTAENANPSLYDDSDAAAAAKTAEDDTTSPTFCSGEIVTWTGGADYWYKTGTSSVDINSTSVSFSNGATGENNPTINGSNVNGKTTGLPDSGTYYQFKVTQNGYLYILGKFDTSKHYVAWEGENRMPYVFAGYDKSLKQVLTCDMSEKATLDENGYIDETFEIDTIWKYVDITKDEAGNNIEAGCFRLAVKKGQTYTFCGTGTKAAISAYCFAPVGETVTITHSADDNSYTLVSETVPGIVWSTIQVGSTDPIVAEGLKTTDSTITVDFVEDASIDDPVAANVTVITNENEEYYTYVQIGEDETKYTVTATADETLSSTWTLTISDEALEAVAQMIEDGETGDLKIVIVAQDADGAYIADFAGDDFPAYEYVVTADTDNPSTETPYTFSTDPFDGETVESLSEFSVQIDNPQDGEVLDIDWENYEESDINVYVIENGEIGEESIASVNSDDYDLIEDDDENTIGYTFHLNNTITENGNYIVSIPAGFFQCGSPTNTSNAITIHVTVQKPVEYELVFTPADGATVESISSITIEEANQQALFFGACYESDVIVYDSDDQPVAYGEDYCTYDEGNTLTTDTGDEYGYVIVFNSTITTAGTYTIVIPEEFVYYGDYSVYNDKIEIKVTIADEEGGDGTGINGITLQAGSDNKFYNLNGQRVSTPTKGIYILNGKKVLIK